MSEVAAPRWTRLGHDERRAQILDEARAQFSARTYGEVSTEAVARAAGVRRGLIHHYFGSKRALFVAVVEDLLVRAAGPVAGGPDLREPDPADEAVVAGPRWPDRDERDAVPWTAVMGPAGHGCDPELAARAAPVRPVAAAVRRNVGAWLDFVEHNSATWFAVMGAEGVGRDPEVEALVDRAREATVERIIGVLGVTDPSPALRAVLQAYGGLADRTTHEWLPRGNLTRAEAAALLEAALLALVRDVVPAVEAARCRPTAVGGSASA